MGESNTGSSPGGKSYLPTKGSSGAFGSTTSSLRFQVNYYATYYYYYGSIFILMNEVEDAFLSYYDCVIMLSASHHSMLRSCFSGKRHLHCGCYDAQGALMGQQELGCAEKGADEGFFNFINNFCSITIYHIVRGSARFCAVPCAVLHGSVRGSARFRARFCTVPCAVPQKYPDVILMDALFVDALKYANEPLDNVEQKDGPFDNMVLMALLNTPLLETPAPRGLLRGGADHARGTEHWPSAQHRSGQLVDCRRTGGENRGLSPGDRTCEGAGAGGCETT